MKETTIYIPTYKRVGRQETWNWIPEELKSRAYLVAVPEEAEALDMLGYNVLSCPVQGIANTRQWIIDQHDLDRGDVALLMDDDLKFAARRLDDPNKFYPLEKGGADALEMFENIEEMMGHVVFGGVAPRSGANRVHSLYRLNSRIFDMWAINVRVARAQGITVNRTEFMEDFDTALQFLSRGYPTLSLNMFVKDDYGSNLAGGCSAYRDGGGQEMAAMALKGLWPDYVTLVERPGWSGFEGTRTDVRVGWAKAFKAGVAGRDILGIPQETRHQELLDRQPLYDLI